MKRKFFAIFAGGLAAVMMTSCAEEVFVLSAVAYPTAITHLKT